MTPATASDNGAITGFALQSQGTYTGTISVNSATGVVSLSNAGPIGTQTITVRATDNAARRRTQASRFPLRRAALDSLDAKSPASPAARSRDRAAQPDGKLIIAGTFNSVLGSHTQQYRAAQQRWDARHGFNPMRTAPFRAWSCKRMAKCCSAECSPPFSLTGHLPQPRGIGSHESMPTDVDNSFDPSANGGDEGVAIQADGKVLLGGAFTTLQHGAASATHE